MCLYQGKKMQQACTDIRKLVLPVFHGISGAAALEAKIDSKVFSAP